MSEVDKALLFGWSSDEDPCIKIKKSSGCCPPWYYQYKHCLCIIVGLWFSSGLLSLSIYLNLSFSGCFSVFHKKYQKASSTVATRNTNDDLFRILIDGAGVWKSPEIHVIDTTLPNVTFLSLEITAADEFQIAKALAEPFLPIITSDQIQLTIESPEPGFNLFTPICYQRSVYVQQDPFSSTPTDLWIHSESQVTVDSMKTFANVQIQSTDTVQLTSLLAENVNITSKADVMGKLTLQESEICRADINAADMVNMSLDFIGKGCIMLIKSCPAYFSRLQVPQGLFESTRWTFLDTNGRNVTSKCHSISSLLTDDSPHIILSLEGCLEEKQFCGYTLNS